MRSLNVALTNSAKLHLTPSESGNGKIGKINRQAVSGADRCLCPDVGGVHSNPRLVINTAVTFPAPRRAVALLVVPYTRCSGLHVRSLYVLNGPMTKGEVLSYAIAFALRRSRKIIRGLKEGLTEEVRYAVADHAVAQLKERGDPWRLNEEAPTAGPPSRRQWNLGQRQALGRHEIEFTISGRLTVNAERFERNREARHALALSVAGVMAVMVTMLLLY
jgi:hypothetical protein